jgi:glycosyltransferase involved in cell wall biosynthesis
MRKITAIISTYNSARFIAGRLDDLLGQTMAKDLEIIIIDSGSEQNEGVIVREYTSRYPNIVYVRTEMRESIYKAWNRAIEKASGRYITNANCDDRLRPDALEVLANELDKDPDVALVYSDFLITGYPNMSFYNHVRTGYSLRPDFIPGMMLSGCYMGPQPMWRRCVHDEIGFFNEAFIAAGDYEFWCRMVAYGYTLKHVSDFLGLYMHNIKGVTNSNVDISVEETNKIKALFKHRLPHHLENIETDYFYSSPVYDHEYANICMVVEQIDNAFQRSFDILWRNTLFPHCITVVYKGNGDLAKVFLNEQKRRGLIKNVVFLPHHRALGEALTLGKKCEPNARYFVVVGMNYSPNEKLWLRHMVKCSFINQSIGAVVYKHGEECVLYPTRTFEAVGEFPKSTTNVINEYFERIREAHYLITDINGNEICQLYNKDCQHAVC